MFYSSFRNLDQIGIWLESNLHVYLREIKVKIPSHTSRGSKLNKIKPRQFCTKSHSGPKSSVRVRHLQFNLDIERQAVSIQILFCTCIFVLQVANTIVFIVQFSVYFYMKQSHDLVKSDVLRRKDEVDVTYKGLNIPAQESYVIASSRK